MAGVPRALWSLALRAVSGGRAAYGTSAGPLPPPPPRHPSSNAARCFPEKAPVQEGREQMWSSYTQLRKMVYDIMPPGVCNLVNTTNIYSNNELSLGNIGVYGFDYDYTLAVYSEALNVMIFNNSRDMLLEKFKYPAGILSYDYRPNFAIRGLHYDIARGLLMKMDAFHYIEPGTVFRGLKAVPDDEVMAMFKGTLHLPLHQVSGFYGKGPKVKQFMDIFSLAEMTLLAVVNDYFITNNISYDPIHLYKDVSSSVGEVHRTGLMYKWILEDMEKYIVRGNETDSVLQLMAREGKKLFLITNSPFNFVDRGMRYMLGNHWRDLFDVVIVQAEKPDFFNNGQKPFRRLEENGEKSWDKITKLEKGQIYLQGNLNEFLQLTDWSGSGTLYFGDHLYSDLADLMLRHGWRTAAIVPELETETQIACNEHYILSLTWLQALTGLVERLQVVKQPESLRILEEWKKERLELKASAKNMFNPYFGSIFRTSNNPTYFSRRLCRFSDIYMSSINCLTNYNLNYTFYPRRTPLQHEAPLWMDQLCTGCMKTPFLQEMAHIR